MAAKRIILKNALIVFLIDWNVKRSLQKLRVHEEIIIFPFKFKINTLQKWCNV